MNRDTDPREFLRTARDVASFLGFVVDQAAHHKFADGFSSNDLMGLSNILFWIGEGLGASDQELREREQQRDIEALRNAGLPEEAFNNERLRAAWRAGFARGLAHQGEEQG